MSDIDVADLAAAAQVLVRAPVRGQPGAHLVAEGDHFIIVADAKSETVAAVLASAAEGLGAQAAVMRLDLLSSVSTNHAGDRPHKVLPNPLRRALLIAPSSAFLASAPIQERPMREQLFGIVDACSIRHAHLPDVTMPAFALGLKQDQASVVQAGQAMAERLASARSIECVSEAGTTLRIELGQGGRWVQRLGEVVPGRSTSFPAGALYTTPTAVRGTFVADASVGEFFGAREGVLKDRPVRLHIDGGRVVKVEAPNAPQLLADVQAMLGVSSNSDRIGLVCIGVNAGALGPTGHAVVDQNRVGLHLFVGNPLTSGTGAGWSARTSFAACQASCRVLIDGRQCIEDGKLVEG